MGPIGKAHVVQDPTCFIPCHVQDASSIMQCRPRLFLPRGLFSCQCHLLRALLYTGPTPVDKDQTCTLVFPMAMTSCRIVLYSRCRAVEQVWAVMVNARARQDLYGHDRVVLAKLSTLLQQQLDGLPAYQQCVVHAESMTCIVQCMAGAVNGTAIGVRSEACASPEVAT
jgi:hypothetical protein